MNLNFKIRLAVKDDASEIGQIYFNTIKSVNRKDYNKEQIDVWVNGFDNTDIWNRKINEQFFYVAEAEDKIIGFGSVTKYGYVDFLFAHKDFQGCGVGSEIMKTISEKASELNLTILWAEVSITARPFFKSRGFVITKRFIKKVDGVEFDDAVMSKIF